MKMYDVYSLFEIEPVKGMGCYVYDQKGEAYLDFYGGHAVISIGHSHPKYVKKITEQVSKLGFYSNSIINSLQQELAQLLAKVSGLKNYDLFMVNSGAEANDNALKLASFFNKRKKVLALYNGFHGRTSATINVTHSGQKYQAPINRGIDVEYFHHNDKDGIIKALSKNTFSSVIIEAIQGIGGLNEVHPLILEEISHVCEKSDTILIMDEIQCGYGRSGEFFAFQNANIRPDIITMAKGMGNGFPVAGLLINAEKLPPVKGRLGSTFGGNHLSCAAALAVLETIVSEHLVNNAKRMGQILKSELSNLPLVKKVKGRGLMLGAEFSFPVVSLRNNLVKNQQLFTGSSTNPNLLRILPPLSITRDDIDLFMHKFTGELNTGNYTH